MIFLIATTGLLFVLLGTIASPYLAFLYTRATTSKCTAPRRIIEPQQCKRILVASKLEERALPNKRLVLAFGINNAFVTTDHDHYKKFVSDVQRLLKETSIDGQQLTTQSRAWTSCVLRRTEEQCDTLLLLPLIQTVAFRTVILHFYAEEHWNRNSDGEEGKWPTEEDIHSITSSINLLWIASKQHTPQQARCVENERRALHLTLCRVFGLAEGNMAGLKNPLNILLPAYETVWRVVLRIFLEIRFRSGREIAYAYTTRLTKFLDSAASTSEFSSRKGNNQVSVKDIVNEGLRMYPPTRRIYRQLDNEEVAIDVEHLHRNTDVWGDDALDFRPQRWAAPSVETKESFMPFGRGRFECPARPVFGPRIIGILVAAIVTNIDEEFMEGWELKSNVDQDIFVSAPLENGRQAYTGLQLIRKRPLRNL